MAGRTVSDTLEAWREINEPLWTQATRRDYISRLKQVQADSITRVICAAFAACYGMMIGTSMVGDAPSFASRVISGALR